MEFFLEREKKALSNSRNDILLESARNWHNMSRLHDYQYMFEVFGLPIIQDPQDIVMLQELIWKYKPDIVIESGVARGGSIVLSASILAILNYVDSTNKRSVKNRGVIGIDIEIRPATHQSISKHPLNPLIKLVEGSSTDQMTLQKVKSLIPRASSVMVVLDSDHTHNHVLKELELYSELVTLGMPLVVMDTGIEFADPSSLNASRGWSHGNNPYSAVQSFLGTTQGQSFEIFKDIEIRHLITCAPDGVLLKTRA